ncbi:MAG: V-type ATPase subunit [Clostridia bacterium]|nr:V-type ATPase subunit [Clostridia bacterium]
MSSYSAVSAKTKAMFGNFLTKADYENIAAKSSVNDICAYLKNETSYTDVFAGMDESSVHRGLIEEQLWVKLNNDYSKIYNFVDDDKKEILDFWFIRLELDYLKHSIRNLFNHEKKPTQEPVSDFFEKKTKIDIQMCMKAKSLDDFIKACENTNYYAYLKRVKAVNSDYFSIAMGLDLFYYEQYWKKIKKLKGQERRAMEKFVGSQIDMQNIIWIYRSKVYFKFSNEQIYTCLIPVRYKLSEELIKELVNSQDGERIISILDKTIYKSLFKRITEGFYVDENYRRIMYKISRLTFRTASDNIAGSCAYIDMKEFEILNIIRVIEGIRYGINPEVIKKHIRIS